MEIDLVIKIAVAKLIARNARDCLLDSKTASGSSHRINCGENTLLNIKKASKALQDMRSGFVRKQFRDGGILS